MTLRKKYERKVTNKKCIGCGKEYPRTDQYFYTKPHPSAKDAVQYYSSCITCCNKTSKKWKEKNKSIIGKKNREYRETERGYFKELYCGITRSKYGHQFKSYEEFFDCWKKQQEFYGLNCPYYPWIQMTRIKGKGKATDTNISKDRILSSMPYGPKNIMFVSWKANNEKGNISPYLATRYLEFVNKSEYCKSVTEFELMNLNLFHNRRYDNDLNMILSIIDSTKESMDLYVDFVKKLREMCEAKPSQIRKDN
jgi:hypothetical protein